MKKIFIDDIKKRGDHSLPGPGRYFSEHVNKKFGDDELMILKQFSSPLKYSMAARLKEGDQALSRSKKLPGPGSYSHAEVTGKPLVLSSIKTESKYSFGKAKDRWYPPTRKIPAPSPDQYNPLNNLNQNYYSIYNQAQQTKIGHNKSSIIDQHFKMQVKTPGPGAYGAFSDFSGLDTKK